MRVSCVIVSYNNGSMLHQAITSVLEQSLSVDEIIVADDGSTDGSRELITTLAAQYDSIKPIFRDKNLGVSMNRDLALREATGDFVTTLDGDDYYLPTKIEDEIDALKRTSAEIAFTDLRILNERNGRSWQEKTEGFASLGPSDRVKWLLWRRTNIPRDMLLSKRLHLMIGYKHDLPTWEDWDYKLRLGAVPGRWAYSGTEGVVHRINAGGLSNQPPKLHLRDEFRVLRSNQKLIREHVGLAYFAASTAREILRMTKWRLIYWRWGIRVRFRKLRSSIRGSLTKGAK